MSETGGPFAGRRWLVDVNTIGQRKAGRLEASAAECRAAAAALQLLDCADLALNYVLQPMPKHGFRLRTQLSCNLVYASVVSLDPVPGKIDEDVESELWPEGEAPDDVGDTEVDVLNAPVIETYSQGRIDLGLIAFELLSVSLDPYPRNAGEALAEDIAIARNMLSPFAVLDKLRKTKT